MLLRGLGTSFDKCSRRAAHASLSDMRRPLRSRRACPCRCCKACFRLVDYQARRERPLRDPRHGRIPLERIAAGVAEQRYCSLRLATLDDFWSNERAPDRTAKHVVATGQAFDEVLLRTLRHCILFYVEDGETRKSVLRQHQRIAIGKIVLRCEDVLRLFAGRNTR
jgi:hypothetical protein